MNRIARLMHEVGPIATAAQRFRRSRRGGHDLPVAPNVIERNFNPDCPNQLWATDITYVWTWQGWLYLTVVLGLFSRRVVCRSTASHMRTELVLDALQMTLERRVPGGDLVNHSDRGSQQQIPRAASPPRHHLLDEPQGRLLRQRSPRDLLICVGGSTVACRAATSRRCSCAADTTSSTHAAASGRTISATIPVGSLHPPSGTILSALTNGNTND